MAAAPTYEGHDSSYRNLLAEASQPVNVIEHLDEQLAKASQLLNTDKPREALALLSPLSAAVQAKTHYGFQSRLGNAYMGVADALVAANELGSFLVTADRSGSWLKPTIHAERISCYLGVLQAYGRFLEILQQPDQRTLFIEKNGPEVLEHVESGQAPQMFWHEWLQKSKQDLLVLPEYKFAGPYAA